jgi:hypothetical protein
MVASGSCIIRVGSNAGSYRSGAEIDVHGEP